VSELRVLSLPGLALGKHPLIAPSLSCPPPLGKRASHLIVGTMLHVGAASAVAAWPGPGAHAQAGRGLMLGAWQPIPGALPLLCVTLHLSPRTSWPGRCRACRSWSSRPLRP